MTERYWAADLHRRVYLFRRQRKRILETCRRIAVVGAISDPNDPSFIGIEKLLGLGLEIIPISSERESLLGMRCYPRLSDFPETIDIVQVHLRPQIDVVEIAKQAVQKQVSSFWIEQASAGSLAVEEILSARQVQLFEHENLVTEYIKHVPVAPTSSSVRKPKKTTRVKERMTPNPATVKPNDSLKDAIAMMERGRFRHLPVIDVSGKLIGMLSDRDIRLIRPSLAFVDTDDAMLQLSSLSVQQAAAFDPIKVTPATTLRDAAQLMLRWQVGGLPVVDAADKLLGIITYTDLLRELVGRDDPPPRPYASNQTTRGSSNG